MGILDKYLKEISSKSLMNNYEIRPSPIHGKGVFSNKDFKKGEFIDTHIDPNNNLMQFGKYLNHSNNPTAVSKKQDNNSYQTYAQKDIRKDDEITLDYTVNQDLEQPQNGWNMDITEKVTVRKNKDDDVEISVDTSDEASSQYSPRSENDYFYMPNKNGIPTMKTVEVKVDSDDLEESSDTVFGQGTNPDPEDETYLSLLKKSTKARVKVDIEEEKEPKKDTIVIDVNRDGRTHDPAYKKPEGA